MREVGIAFIAKDQGISLLIGQNRKGNHMPRATSGIPISPLLNQIQSLSLSILNTARGNQSLFKPFIFEGSVSKSEGTEAFPVSILKDAAAAEILWRRGASIKLKNHTQETVIVRGFGGTVTVPLCRIYLHTKLLSKSVTVDVKDSLPAEGTASLMANDIARDIVVPDPVVRAKPLMSSPIACYRI